MTKALRVMSVGWIVVMAGCGDSGAGKAQRAFLTAPTLDVHGATPVSTNQIVFVTEEFGGSAISIMNADGSGRRRLTTDQTLYTSPAVSPNGTRILYMGWTSPGVSIFIMRADGTDKRRLTFGRFDGSPSWSPDGRRIAFGGMVRTPYGDAGRIFVMDAEGSGVHQVSPDPLSGSNFENHVSATWSPDGRRLAYSSNGGLVIVGTDGSNNLMPIQTGGYYCLYPDWSPNGARIACTGFGNGEWAVYSVRPDGTGFRVHVRGQAQVEGADWSPVDMNLVFARLVAGRFQLFRAALEPTTTEQPLSGNAIHEHLPRWVAKISAP